MAIEYLTGLNAIVMKAIWNIEKRQGRVTIQDLVEEIKERARPFIFKKIESKRSFFDIKKHPFKVEMDMKSYQDIDGIAI